MDPRASTYDSSITSTKRYASVGVGATLPAIATATGTALDAAIPASVSGAVTTARPLGNFPQAFSHIGPITAACQLDQARGRIG
jgi:hypothetical protein